GVSDAFIGLTVVAIGTSAPELATTIISTIRGDRDIAIGNLIGSSTYNLTIIMGASLFFAPGYISLSPELIYIDIPVMALVSLVCIPLARSRLSGAPRADVEVVTGYEAFLAYVRLRCMGGVSGVCLGRRGGGYPVRLGRVLPRGLLGVALCGAPVR